MNLKNYLSKELLTSKKENIKKIFFFRVCGTGMGSAACLLKEAGFVVEGCDETFYPPMSTYLEKQNIKLIDQKEVNNEFLSQYDLIIVGNVVPKKSEAAKLIEESGVYFTSFPTAIGSLLLKDKTVLGIAGTHGKTTTSYFLTQMLNNLNEDSGYLIGGVIEGQPSSSVGTSKYFVIESDEYDSCYFEKYSKFLSYEINHLILTSLEYDHADIFDSIEDIKNEFKKLKLENNSQIIVCDEYEASKNLYLNQTMYGQSSKIGPHEINCSSNKSSFSLILNDENVEFETNVIGVHNVMNIAACLILCSNLGFNAADLINSIKKLNLVKRRQEIRGKYNDAILIDDFAHHPTAVSSTIDIIKTKYPDKKINVILEPNSATARSNLFQDEFEQSLLKSDSVFLCRPSRNSSIKDHINLDMDLIVKGLIKNNVDSKVSDKLEDLTEFIEKKAHSDELFLILSNSTCLGLWSSNFVKKIV